MSINKRECRGRWSSNALSDNSLCYNVYQQAGVQRAAALCWGVGYPHFSPLGSGVGKDLVTALKYLSYKEVRNGRQ